MYSFQTSTREGQLIKELPVFLLPFMKPPLFLISLQPARYVLEVVKKIRSRYVTITVNQALDTKIINSLVLSYG